MARYFKYTAETRRDWVKDNLPRIDAEGLSYRQVALEIKSQFGLDKPVSTATIQRDLQAARTSGIQPYSPEAMELLKPENFPAFRSLFPAPGGGPYQTNETHHALHWVIYSLTRKVDLPQWVIDHFELPEDINQDIVQKAKLLTFVLLLAPRHGKTMTVIHSLINLICEFPDVRMIYCQGIKETSMKAMGVIMSELERNDELKRLYGPFQDDDRPWSHRDGFEVSRRTIAAITPTMMPAGINSNVRSLDADIIIIDDPQDLERAESERTTEKDYAKLTTEFMTRREPHTPVLMIGSHLPTLHGDVFSQLEDNLADLQTEGQAIIMRKRPAHNLDKCLGMLSAGDTPLQGDDTLMPMVGHSQGKPDHRPPANTRASDSHIDCLEWPEMRDWNFLESQRVLLGEELFEAVYQQEARIPGSRPFPPEIVKQQREDGGILDQARSWKDQTQSCLRCQGKLYTTLGFDPAAGEGKKASYSALAVLDGCIQCRTLYLIDYWQKRQSPELHAATIASFAKSFDVQYVRVEDNAYQKALARDKELREAAREQRFVIDEWRTDDRKNTPELGIPMLSRYMRDDKFSVPAKTWEDQRYYKELERAFIRYPLKPNDLPMAIWLAAGMMWQVWELYVHTEPIYLPGREENTPEYMIDQPLRFNLAAVGARE